MLSWSNISIITLTNYSKTPLTIPSLALSSDNYVAQQNILNKIVTPYTLALSNVSVNQIANSSNPSYILSNSKIKSVSITDTSAHIVSNLTNLNNINNQNLLSHISFSDSPTTLTLTLTPAQLGALAAVLSSLTSPVMLDASPTHVADIANLDALKAQYFHLVLRLMM